MAIAFLNKEAPQTGVLQLILNGKDTRAAILVYQLDRDAIKTAVAASFLNSPPIKTDTARLLSKQEAIETTELVIVLKSNEAGT